MDEQSAGAKNKIVLLISRIVLGVCSLLFIAFALQASSLGNTREATFKLIVAGVFGIILILPMVLAKKK